jgi:hypothetical protein
MDEVYEEVRARLPAAARDAFILGLAHADSTLYRDAVDDFTLAMEQAPDWGAPIYNRALMYETLGLIGESLADYRLYIDTAPTAVDPVVVMVSERIGLLEAAASAETPSPLGALALGIVPGMGHYYTSRPLGGTVVLGVAGAALATGLLVKDVTVYCVNEVPSGGTCPQDQIVDEVTDRPYLGPALDIAAAVGLVGAVEALVKARRRRANAQAVAAEREAQTGLRLEAPSVESRGSRVDLNLLRFRFR